MGFLRAMSLDLSAGTALGTQESRLSSPSQVHTLPVGGTILNHAQGIPTRGRFLGGTIGPLDGFRPRVEGSASNQDRGPVAIIGGTHDHSAGGDLCAV